jgi:uncharacterized protein YkwD
MKLAVFLLLATPALAVPDWYQGTPEAFARRPEAQARIDPAHFDGELMAAAIFHETNRTRRRLGLPPFRHLAKLDAAGDLKASVGIFEPEVRHESALPLTATPADRVKSVGLDFSRVAENIARLPAYDLPDGTKRLEVRKINGREVFYRMDTGRPAELHTYAGFAAYVVDSWMNSPGHRANIVSPALVSLGCAARPCQAPISGHEQIYAVQVFHTPPQ